MPLIKTIAEIRKYIPVDVNLNFELIKPAIEEAEELFIKDMLGAFYPVLLASYTTKTNADGSNKADPDGMTDDDFALMPFVQRTLGYYAMFLSVENMGVAIGGEGIQQTFGDHSQPAPKWKVRDLQSNYINKADRFADKLLEYMEGKANDEIFAEWFTDLTANTAMSGAIVYSTNIASKYIDINQSRRVFLRLKKRIADIEASNIKSFICGDQYDAIIDALKDPDTELTSEQSALIKVLEPYIAKKALYDTLPSLRVTITADGIHLLSITDSSVIQQPATDKDIERLMCSLKDGSFGYLAAEDAIKTFIQTNISDYPLIAASACYSATSVSRKWVADNDQCNKHFSV